jgi:hypothetical protein
LATSIGEGDAALGGGVTWLPISELLLDGAIAVAGGIAGLMKRSDVRRPPYHIHNTKYQFFKLNYTATDKATGYK